MRKAKTLLQIAVLLTLTFTWAKADLEITFLDVGQGDATLVLCDGESLLIDGGQPSASRVIYSHLQKSPLRGRLDYIIATHPHEDHVGGLSAALNALPVDLILTPVTEWDTPAFHSLKKYASAQGTPMVVPSEGDQLKIGGATLTIVHCWPEAWNENDMSIVCRLEYGNFTALFTGDAEYTAEYMMIDGNYDIKSDLLKVGHHGSGTSSSAEFISAVSPEYAVISCGAANEYGHPHQEVLDTLRANKTEIFRTDLQGNIVFHVTDKGEIYKTTERIEEQKNILQAPAPTEGVAITRAATTGYYIINTKTGKFHLPDCDAAKEISVKNRKEYTGSREELIEASCTPCRRCHP